MKLGRALDRSILKRKLYNELEPSIVTFSTACRDFMLSLTEMIVNRMKDAGCLSGYTVFTRSMRIVEKLRTFYDSWIGVCIHIAVCILTSCVLLIPTSLNFIDWFLGGILTGSMLAIGIIIILEPILDVIYRKLHSSNSRKYFHFRRHWIQLIRAEFNSDGIMLNHSNNYVIDNYFNEYFALDTLHNLRRNK